MFKAKVFSIVLIASSFLYDVAYSNCPCPGYNNRCECGGQYCETYDNEGNCHGSDGQRNGCYCWP